MTKTIGEYIRKLPIAEQNAIRLDERNAIQEIGFMKFAVDRREKLPYMFTAYKSVEPILKILATGDYSICGHEDSIAVERKTLEDFLGSITASRKRFFREMHRLHRITHRCIVVEDTWEAIIEGCWERRITIESVAGTIMCILQDFDIPVYFCGDRFMAQGFTYRYLEYHWRKWYQSKEPLASKKIRASREKTEKKA